MPALRVKHPLSESLGSLRSNIIAQMQPEFGPRLRSCCDGVLRAFSNGGATAAVRASLIDDVYSVIEPYDVAGLCDRSRCNWHPVTARDLLNASGKLGVSQAEIKELLARSGFVDAGSNSPAPIAPAALQGQTRCNILPS